MIKQAFSSFLPPMIMGILNVTPDSFSDGGQHNSLERALKHALKILEQGADIIDIGGESTRPGADIVSAKEQIKRVVPVIKALRKKSKVTISIDTTNLLVAEAALRAGANWINDVSAGEDAILEDGTEAMLQLAAEKKASIVLMHRQGVSATMQDSPDYVDVVKEVCNYLEKRASIALNMGILKENIILDPGIGFGKSFGHNISLMGRLDDFVALGYSVLLGTSRKRFLGEICQQDDPKNRVVATCATTVLGVNAGITVFRVHDIAENRDAADVAWKIKCASVRANE